jgi:hypothetical protein
MDDKTETDINRYLGGLGKGVVFEEGERVEEL